MNRLKSLVKITQKEILMITREAFSWVTPLLFFALIVCFLPIALGSDPAVLAKIAPGCVWIAALLAILLSMNSLFRQDAESGCLDLFLTSPLSLTSLVFCKIISHWMVYCLPLIIISPFISFLLNLSSNQAVALTISLFLGTFTLSLLGAIGAGLIVGIRGNGLLLPILIMPLYIPVLIFGTGVIIAAGLNQPLGGYYSILGALALCSLAFAPWFTGIALRIGVNQ